MKNPMNVARLTNMWFAKPITLTEVWGLPDDVLQAMSREVHIEKKPFYRVWYYIRVEWNTGFSDTELANIRTLFNNMKKSEIIVNNEIVKRAKLRDNVMVITNDVNKNCTQCISFIPRQGTEHIGLCEKRTIFTPVGFSTICEHDFTPKPSKPRKL